MTTYTVSVPDTSGSSTTINSGHPSGAPDWNDLLVLNCGTQARSFKWQDNVTWLEGDNYAEGESWNGSWTTRPQISLTGSPTYPGGNSSYTATISIYKDQGSGFILWHTVYYTVYALTGDPNITREFRRDGVANANFEYLSTTTTISDYITGAGGNTAYRAIATSASSDGTVPNAQVLYQSAANGSRTTITASPLTKPTKQGERVYYKWQYRRTTSYGGDNVWRDTNATGLYYTFKQDAPSGSIVEPSWGTEIGPNVTATMGIKTAVDAYNEIRYSLDFGAWTTSRVGAVPRGETVWFRARNYNPNSTQYGEILQASYLVPLASPDTSINATFEQSGSPLYLSQYIDGTSNVTLELTGCNGYTDYRLSCTSSSTGSGVTVGAIQTNNGDGLRTSITFNLNSVTDVPQQQGSSANYKVLARLDTDAGGDGVWYDTNQTSLVLVRQINQATIPSVSYGSEISATTTATIAAQTAPTGCTTEYSWSSTYPTFSTTRTFSATRGTSYTYYVRFKNTASGQTYDSLRSTTEAAPYLNPDTNITYTLAPATQYVENSSISNATVTIANGGPNTTYRVAVTGTASVSGGVGSRVGNGAITLSNPGELPISGEVVNYKIEAKRTIANGGNDTYTDTGETFYFARLGTCSFTLQATTVVQEGASDAISRDGPGYAPDYTVSGTVGATYAGNVTALDINQDNNTDGNWASAGYSGSNTGVGTTSASRTGTIDFNVKGLPGSAGSYRLKGEVTSGDGVDSVSPHIDLTIPVISLGVTPASQSFEGTYSVDLTNTLTSHDYLIADTSNGDLYGGLAWSGGAQPTGTKSTVKQGTGGNLTFSPSDGTLNPGDTKTYYVWTKRRTNSDGNWYYTNVNYQVTYLQPITMGTTTISPSEGVGAGTTVTISGSATVTGTTINDIFITDVDGNAPVISETPTGLNTTSASITGTFTSVDLDRTYTFKVGATTPGGATGSSNTVNYISTASGSTTAPSIPDDTYGMRIKNASDVTVMDASSTPIRWVTSGSTSTTSGSPSTNVSITGMTNSDSWIVAVLPQGAGNLVKTSVTKGAGQFTITTDYTGTGLTSQNYTYWVMRG